MRSRFPDEIRSNPIQALSIYKIISRKFLWLTHYDIFNNFDYNFRIPGECEHFLQNPQIILINGVTFNNPNITH